MHSIYSYAFDLQLHIRIYQVASRVRCPKLLVNVPLSLLLVQNTALSVGWLTGVHEPSGAHVNGPESGRWFTREESFARQQIQRVESMQEPTGTLITMKSDGVNKPARM